MFVTIFARALQKAHSRLLDRDLLDVAPSIAGLHVASTAGMFEQAPASEEVSFVDDCVHSFMDSDPQRLVQRVCDALAVIADCFAEFGLALNFAKGKTEVVIRFRGVGASSFAQSFYSGNDGLLQVLTKSGPQQVHVVDSYRHLGTIFERDLSLGPEIKNRLNLHHAAMSDGLSRSLAANWMDLVYKRQLISLLSTSRLFHNAHIWEPLNKSLFTSVHHAHAKAVRTALGKTFFKDVANTPDKLLWTYGFDKPGTILRRKRLLYLPRLLVDAPRELRSWIAANSDTHGSWGSLVVGDLVWMWHRCEELGTLPGPSSDMPAWERRIVCLGKRWNLLVKHVCAGCHDEDSDAPVVNSADVEEESGLIRPVECPYCGLTFGLGNSLTSHLRKHHGYRCLAHFHLNTSGDCFSCLKRFHNPIRLREHFADSSRCLRSLVLEGHQRNSQEVTDEIAQVAKLHCSSLLKGGRYAAFAARPVVQLPGPCPPLRSGPWNDRGFVCIDGVSQRLSITIRNKRSREAAR